MLPALWNAVINRGLEQEKRLAALKTKIKKLMRENAANADPQEFEGLADELDEMAQLTWALKRKKRTKNEVTSLDLLEAADMLREASIAAGGAEHRELIEKLRIRLSPHEEQLFQISKK
jgi:protein subunit release factor A